MTRILRVLAGAAALALVLAWPSMASVPKIVFAEDFTATFCQFCPPANCALDTVAHRFDPRFDYVETHGNFSPPDPFVTPETTARINRYHVTGYPTVWFDGVIARVGANPCPTMINVYTNDVNTRLNVTGGLSPIRIDGLFVVNTATKEATFTANFTLVDPGSFTGYQATLYVFEDSVACCTGFGGQNVWDKVVRMVRSTPLTLNAQGDVGTVTQVYSYAGVSPVVNGAHLHALALYEEIAGARTIIQAGNTFLNDPTAVSPIDGSGNMLTLNLGQNPVQTEARLRFSLGAEEARNVRLAFMDAGGRVVRMLEDGPRREGAQEAVWDLRDDNGHPVPNGFYFAKMYTRKSTASAKVVILR